MKLSFAFIVFLLLLTSCSNINFLLETKKGSGYLKNNTTVYIDGGENPILKEVLFLRLGETVNKKFVLKVTANETQTKRSVNKNQVAQKIDYKIKINYSLSDNKNKCPNVEKTQTSGFSYTPKSAGYNFASDVLLKNLLEEAISSNLNSFMSFVDNKLQSYNCLDEN